MATLAQAASPFNLNSYDWQNAGGNGNYSLNGFRFNDASAASNPQLQQFNTLANSGNYNDAYSSLMSTGGGVGSNALKQAFAGSTDPNMVHTIINAYSPGGSNQLGNGNTYDANYQSAAPGHFDAMGNWTTQTRQPGSGQSGAYTGSIPVGGGFTPGAPGGFMSQPGINTPPTTGGVGGGQPAPTTGTTAGAPAGSTPIPTTGTTAPIPGQGSTSYSTPITDPSAYLDPSAAYTEKQGMDALQNSAAARGGLLSGQTLKDITNYSQGQASTNWQNAFNNAQTDVNRMYNVDNTDRNFQYNAQTGDRNFNQQASQYLSSLGLQSTQNNSQLAAALAAILSNNSIAAGQAQGTGTIGANNAISSSLSAIIGQLTGNNALSGATG